MNKKFNRKNKINNLLKRKLNSLINNNRYRRINRLNAVPYIVKNKPQKYGPGRNLCVINGVYSLTEQTTYRIALETMLLSNNEFSTRKLFFRYFKVLEVRAVFLPSGKYSNSFHFLNFSWNSIEETQSDIVKDDCSKIVPYYRPRTKIVRWRPIRSVINVNSVSQEVPVNFINMTEFISTDRVLSLPGWLYITSTSEGDQFMFEIVVEFRGNDFGDSPKSAKLHELESLVEKMKLNLEKNRNNKITDLLPAENIINEEIERNNEENEEDREEEIKRNSKKNYNLKFNSIRESVQPISRVLDIEKLEPLRESNPRIQPTKNIFYVEEENSYQDIEEPSFPKEFTEKQNYNIKKRNEEFKGQLKTGSGKEEFLKFESQNVVIKRAESKRKHEKSTEKRKENMKNADKNLLVETSKKSELPFKDSEIT